MVLLCIVGCAEDPPQLRLDVPIEDSDRTIVLGIEQADELSVSAHAISADRTIAPVSRTFELDRTLRVTAQLYDRELEALRIPEGALVEAPGGRMLPPAARSVFTEIVDGDPTEWSEVVSSPALESFRFASTDSGCAELEVATIPLAGNGPPTFALGFDEGVLFALSDGQLMFIDRSRRITVLSTGRVFFSAAEDEGRIWLGSVAGEI